MLENGADVNIKDDAGKTAFDLANDGGYFEVAELIKTFNSSVNKSETLEETSDKAVDPE